MAKNVMTKEQEVEGGTQGVNTYKNSPEDVKKDVDGYMSPASDEGVRYIKQMESEKGANVSEDEDSEDEGGSYKDNMFSQRLRYIRKMLCISRAEVAEETNISHDSLRSWELGRSNISGRSIEKTIVAYGGLKVNVSESWILNGEGPMPEIPETPEYAILRTLEQKSPGFVGYVDKGESVLHVNEKFEGLFKVPASKALGCKLKNVLHASVYKKIIAYINAALDGCGCSFEYPLEEDGTSNVEYVKVDCIPDYFGSKSARGVFIFVGAESSLVKEGVSNDNETAQHYENSYGLPSIEVSQVSFDKNLYMQVVEVAVQVAEKYHIKKDYKIISKVIDHLYQFSVVSKKVDHSYADTVVQIAVRTGAMPVEG
jgi:transcriptional regulator with XRE-family HTH domain